MSFFRIAVLLVLALVLSSCRLFIPDQDLGDTVLRIDAKEVPLQTQRRKVVTASSLAPQQEDADCAKTLELPAGCEIVGLTPKGDGAVVYFNDQRNDVPGWATPREIVTNLGIKPKLIVNVPESTVVSTLPQKITLTKIQITLKLFDAKLTAEEAAKRDGDLAKKIPDKLEDNVNITFSRPSACTPVTIVGVKQQQCVYTTSNATENILQIRFTEINKLLKLITKNAQGESSGKSLINTLAGSAELHFPKLEGGNLPKQGVSMMLELDEGKSIAKIR